MTEPRIMPQFTLDQLAAIEYAVDFTLVNQSFDDVDLCRDYLEQVEKILEEAGIHAAFMSGAQ